jgi:ABC-2 type transport system permease protein
MVTSGARQCAPPLTSSWSPLVPWTAAIGFLAVALGSVSSEVVTEISSATVQELIHRIGGAGSLRDALTGAELSLAATLATAFGVAVMVRGSRRDDPNAESSDWSKDVLLQSTVVALAGTAWLLFVTGSLYTVGEMLVGGPASLEFVRASTNHAPAVWTIEAMTAVAWSFRATWAFVGWILVAVFAFLEYAGRLLGFPQWIVDFSPYARVASMPAEGFDSNSTIALSVGCCVLMCLAIYNRYRHTQFVDDV